MRQHISRYKKGVVIKIRAITAITSAVVLALAGFPTHAAVTANIYPTSDYSVTWSRSAGTNNWSNVNDSEWGGCNGYYDYNYTTVAETDLYGVPLSSIPNGSTITQVVITPCYAASGTPKLVWSWNGGGLSSKILPASPGITSGEHTWNVSFVKQSTTTFQMGMYSIGNGLVVLSSIKVRFIYN